MYHIATPEFLPRILAAPNQTAWLGSPLLPLPLPRFHGALHLISLFYISVLFTYVTISLLMYIHLSMFNYTSGGYVIVSKVDHSPE